MEKPIVNIAAARECNVQVARVVLDAIRGDVIAGSDCVVVTDFEHAQVGVLDFSYRIRALAKVYRLTIVSRVRIDHPELRVEAAEYVVLPAGEDRVGWLRYMWNCVRLIRARRPQRVVLMSFRLSPVALLSGSIPTALYWNDHPTHFATPPQTFAPVKRVIRAALRSLVWCGARNTSLVMPISEFHVKDLLANGCDADRICVIQMGVDRSFSGVALNSAPRNCNGPLELLYIGTVSKIRGRDVMLDAMARVNARSTIACLTFVGVLPDQVEYCIARGRELGISEAVRVVGRIPGHEIPQLMKNADAGICIMEDQTWYRFNPPTKLFEYLVAGLPVLASDIRTHTKYIRHWDNGLIFDYGDSALAQAIDELWLRRAELPALKQRAWESGKQYLWDEIEGVFLESVSNMEHE